MHAGGHEGMILGAQHSTEKVVTPNRVGCLGIQKGSQGPNFFPDKGLKFHPEFHLFDVDLT